MKLICVQKFRSANGMALPDHMPVPEVFDRCESISEHRANGKIYYQLEGYPQNCGYNAEAFATLPTESEELEIEAQKEAILM